MRPLNKKERAYAADRIGVIWLRRKLNKPAFSLSNSIRQDHNIPIPTPMKRYHEVWDVIDTMLKLAGIAP